MIMQFGLIFELIACGVFFDKNNQRSFLIRAPQSIRRDVAHSE